MELNRKKRRNLLIGILITPTLLCGLITPGLMFYRTPTRITAELHVDRLEFTGMADEDQSPVSAEIFAEITVQDFAEVSFQPTSLGQGAGCDLPTKCVAWENRPVKTTVKILSQDELTVPALTFLPLEKTRGIRLGHIYIPEGMRLVFERKNTRLNLHLNCEKGSKCPRPEARMSVKGEVGLIAENVKLRIGDEQEQELGYGVLKAGFSALDSQVQAQGRNKELGLSLGLKPKSKVQLLSPPGVRIRTVKFIKRGLREGSVVSSILTKTTLKYADHPELVKLEPKIGVGEFLALEQLERFRIRSLIIEPEKAGMKVQLDGVADQIRYGTRDFSQDGRIILFDLLLHNRYLAVFLSLIFWFFPTTLGGYRLWREFRK